MSAIAEVRHHLETSEAGELVLTGLTETDSPLLLDRPYVLKGDGAAILRVESGNAIEVDRDPVNGATVIENLRIQTSGYGGDAIRMVNRGPRDHSQRARVENVLIEPANQWDSSFARGLVYDDCWNTLTRNVDIVGRYSDITPAALRSAAMECGIDFIEGQEHRTENVRITGINILG